MSAAAIDRNKRRKITAPRVVEVDGWAHIDKQLGDPFKGETDWWAFDVFKTRAESKRTCSIGEKIVRVRVRLLKAPR